MWLASRSNSKLLHPLGAVWLGVTVFMNLPQVNRVSNARIANLVTSRIHQLDNAVFAFHQQGPIPMDTPAIL